MGEPYKAALLVACRQLVMLLKATKHVDYAAISYEELKLTPDEVVMAHELAVEFLTAARRSRITVLPGGVADE